MADRAKQELVCSLESTADPDDPEIWPEVYLLLSDAASRQGAVDLDPWERITDGPLYDAEVARHAHPDEVQVYRTLARPG